MSEDSSPPLPDEQAAAAAEAAALAAMREEWARIKDDILRPLPTPSEEEVVVDDEVLVAAVTRRTELMEGVLGRHGAVLVSLGMEPGQANGSELMASREEILRVEEERKQAEETLLQAGANVGDALLAQAVAGLTALEILEAMTQEEWDALTPKERGQTFDALEMLRGARGDFLSRLPLEQRREWERRLGN